MRDVAKQAAPLVPVHAHRRSRTGRSSVATLIFTRPNVVQDPRLTNQPIGHLMQSGLVVLVPFWDNEVVNIDVHDLVCIENVEQVTA